MKKAGPFFLLTALLCGCQFDVNRKDIELTPMQVAYKHVLDNWSPASDGAQRRGYNIAAVLVDPTGKIVSKELNTVIESQDCTQHAEMRLIQNYIRKNKTFNLNGFTVFTTLEPCAMCSAAMSMAGIDKVYYGQSDVFFGKAAERMGFDSSAQGGYTPYPRVVKSELLQSCLQKSLEEAFSKSGIKEITRWLATDEARNILVNYFHKIDAEWHLKH